MPVGHFGHLSCADEKVSNVVPAWGEADPRTPAAQLKLSRQRRPWMRRPPSPVRLSVVMTVVVRVVPGVTTLCAR